jgi:hypothetical protein
MEIWLKQNGFSCNYKLKCILLGTIFMKIEGQICDNRSMKK